MSRLQAHQANECEMRLQIERQNDQLSKERRPLFLESSGAARAVPRVTKLWRGVCPYKVSAAVLQNR